MWVIRTLDRHPWKRIEKHLKKPKFASAILWNMYSIIRIKVFVKRWIKESLEVRDVNMKFCPYHTSDFFFNPSAFEIFPSLSPLCLWCIYFSSLYVFLSFDALQIALITSYCMDVVAIVSSYLCKSKWWPHCLYVTELLHKNHETRFTSFAMSMTWVEFTSFYCLSSECNTIYREFLQYRAKVGSFLSFICPFLSTRYLFFLFYLG